MDVQQFEALPITKQSKHFWESERFIDSYKGDDTNYFLYKDTEADIFYMELWLEHDPNGKRGINALNESETVKYMVPHTRAELPWV